MIVNNTDCKNVFITVIFENVFEIIPSIGMGEEVYKIILTCGADVLSLNKIFELRTPSIFLSYLFSMLC
jgi:hypothetical protein